MKDGVNGEYPFFIKCLTMSFLPRCAAQYNTLNVNLDYSDSSSSNTILIYSSKFYSLSWLPNGSTLANALLEFQFESAS